MNLIAIIIAIEIIIGVVTIAPLGQTQHKNIYNDTTHRNVLGESDNPDQQPTDTPALSQDGTTQQDQNPTNTQPETPPEAPTQEGPPQQTGQETAPPPENSPAQIETTQALEETPLQGSSKATFQLLDSSVFPDVTVATPSDKLSEQTVTEVTQQNEQLDNAKTPQDQASLLVQFETSNVQNLNTNLKNNKFDDLAFNAERLSYQIDKTIDAIQSLNQTQSQEFRNKIDTICKNANYLLRPGELLVPEGLEQTIEITRGKCFNFEKQ